MHVFVFGITKMVLHEIHFKILVTFQPIVTLEGRNFVSLISQIILKDYFLRHTIHIMFIFSEK